MKTIFCYFVVTGSFVSERNYRQHKRIGVVARDIERAIAAAKAMYSEQDISIFDVSHHGTVDIIDSDAEVLVIADVEEDGVTLIRGDNE